MTSMDGPTCGVRRFPAVEPKQRRRGAIAARAALGRLDAAIARRKVRDPALWIWRGVERPHDRPLTGRKAEACDRVARQNLLEFHAQKRAKKLARRGR